MVQWLRFQASTAEPQVQSLVRELRSPELHGADKKKKKLIKKERKRKKELGGGAKMAEK